MAGQGLHSVSRISQYDFHNLFFFTFRSGLDAYSVLALISFSVFLFYILFRFLTNNGNGKRSFATIPGVVNDFKSILEENTEKVMAAIDKFEDHEANKI